MKQKKYLYPFIVCVVAVCLTCIITFSYRQICIHREQSIIVNSDILTDYQKAVVLEMYRSRLDLPLNKATYNPKNYDSDERLFSSVAYAGFYVNFPDGKGVYVEILRSGEITFKDVTYSPHLTLKRNIIIFFSSSFCVALIWLMIVGKLKRKIKGK